MEEKTNRYSQALISKMREFHEDEPYSIYIRPQVNDGGGWTIHCDIMSIEEDYDEGFCSYDGSNSEMEEWTNSLGISDEKSLAELMLVNHRLLIEEYIKLWEEDSEDITLFSKLTALNWQMEYLKKFNCLNYIKDFSLFDSSMEEYLSLIPI